MPSILHSGEGAGALAKTELLTNTNNAIIEKAKKIFFSYYKLNLAYLNIYRKLQFELKQSASQPEFLLTYRDKRSFAE